MDEEAPAVVESEKTVLNCKLRLLIANSAKLLATVVSVLFGTLFKVSTTNFGLISKILYQIADDRKISNIGLEHWSLDCYVALVHWILFVR